LGNRRGRDKKKKKKKKKKKNKKKKKKKKKEENSRAWAPSWGRLDALFGRLPSPPCVPMAFKATNGYPARAHAPWGMGFIDWGAGKKNKFRRMVREIPIFGKLIDIHPTSWHLLGLQNPANHTRADGRGSWRRPLAPPDEAARGAPRGS